MEDVLDNSPTDVGEFVNTINSDTPTTVGEIIESAFNATPASM